MGVNVDFDVFRIRTVITEQGSSIEAGYFVDRRDRRTRKVRWEQLEEDLTFTAKHLDREVVVEDQIRTVIRAFRDKLLTEIFPERTHVPKTVIFAKDDSHADDIVRIVREEFDKGNDFCQKITYKTTGVARRGVTDQVPQQLRPPHRSDGGHDRDRHRHQAARDRLLHAFRGQPRLL